MLEGRGMVCLSTTDWDEIWGSRQQIMRRFARAGNRVLFVERQVGPEQLFGYRGRLERKRALWKRGLIEAESDLFLWSPPVVWPFRNYSPWCSARGQALLRREMTPVMEKLNMRRPLLWIYQFHSGRLIGTMNEIASVYHCIDQYKGGFTGRKRRTMEHEESITLSRADLVFVHGKALLEEKRGLRPAGVMRERTWHMPSGADVGHYRPAAYGEAAEPGELKSIPRPRAMLMGTLDGRIDYELLRDVFAEKKDWSLILLGERKADLNSLDALPNVHSAGRRPFAELPAWLAHADAGLIPYRISEATRYIDPLKVHEYLAAGLPVVAAPLPEVEAVPGDVMVARSAEEFGGALEKARGRAGETDRRRRHDLAAGHSWDIRVEEMSRPIEAFLAEKGIA